MENDFAPREQGGTGDHPVTPDEAREALRRLDVDGAALADRLDGPAWYHPILGAITAGLALGMGLPDLWSTVAVALGIVALAVLMHVYRDHYGVVTSRAPGPRSRRVLVAAIAVLVVGMLAGLVVKLAELPLWWMLPLAALVGVLTWLLGERYDAAARIDLAGGEEPSA